jgi:inhibitor of cysteine peptidase
VSYLAVTMLAAVVAASPNKTVKMSDFRGDNATETKVKVLKDEITVKPGDTFSVKLEANPTTGYTWKVLGPGYGPLELKKDKYEPRGGKGAGGGGTHVFEFTAKEKNQQIVLVFIYGRSFEGLGPNCYQLRVKVEE